MTWHEFLHALELAGIQPDSEIWLPGGFQFHNDRRWIDLELVEQDDGSYRLQPVPDLSRPPSAPS